MHVAINVAVLLGILLLRGVYTTRVHLRNNGYEGLVIAINPAVRENSEIIDGIKKIWTEASATLFTATNNRAYFRDVTILVPETWREGSYGRASGQTYTDADVLIATPNPVFWHVPYTLQHGGCGERGEYIHLTPSYVTHDQYVYDTGPKDKVIVHEWAHLRWGVFDETQTSGFDAFYLTRGIVQATRCPAALRGENWRIDYDEGTIEQCTYDEQTLQPIGDCQFVAYKNQPDGLHASMMSHQYLDDVIGFCHNDPDDPFNYHNKAAPNEHNRLCSLKSVWEVIMESTDFQNEANPPNNEIVDTTPTFNVVQQGPPRYVLVMDVSGSMNDQNRLFIMQRAVDLFLLNYVAEGSFVGLVSFNDETNILSDLLEINPANRAQLVRHIPDTAADGTGIGGGIQKGIEVLAQSGYRGGNLIVLTDGEENEAPFVENVYNEVLEAGVELTTIFLDLLDVDENPILANLSMETGGKWFFASSASTSSDIIDIFQALSATNDGDSFKRSFQIHSTVLSVGVGESRVGTVLVDATIGNNTLFAFSWLNYPAVPRIVLKDPSGCFYTSEGDPTLTLCTSGTVAVDDTLKTVKFQIIGTAESGRWLYVVSNTNSPISEDVTVTVTSMASDSKVYPIEVDASMALTDVTSVIPTVVYAKVSQGFSPVLDAVVTAIITTPLGAKVTSQLFDNGAGADVRKNDGVYSRYFTQFDARGRYSLRVKVERNTTGSTSPSAGSPANFNPGTITANGTLNLNPNGLSNQPDNANAVIPVDFERVDSGGGFSFSGEITSEDKFPPNKITDLVVSQKNLNDPGDGISLQFTAPGDDMDSGNASRYDIRYSFGDIASLVDNFDGSNAVLEANMLEGRLDRPNPGLSQENLLFTIPDFPDEDTVQLAVGVVPYDEAGNQPGPSNIPITTVFLQRSALPTQVPESTTGTVEREEVSDSGQLATFQILTGVFVALTVIFIIATAVLAIKLYNTPKKGGKISAKSDNVYENMGMSTNNPHIA